MRRRRLHYITENSNSTGALRRYPPTSPVCVLTIPLCLIILLFPKQNYSIQYLPIATYLSSILNKLLKKYNTTLKHSIWKSHHQVYSSGHCRMRLNSKAYIMHYFGKQNLYTLHTSIVAILKISFLFKHYLSSQHQIKLSKLTNFRNKFFTLNLCLLTHNLCEKRKYLC